MSKILLIAAPRPDSNQTAMHMGDGRPPMGLAYISAYVEQFGHGEHTATIGLYGNYGTNLDLVQKGNSDQTYSLTQNCQTVGGCTVNITQQ